MTGGRSLPVGRRGRAGGRDQRTAAGPEVLPQVLPGEPAFEEALPVISWPYGGYSSWQSWYDAALKRLVGEYGARKRALSVREGRKC